MTGLWPGQTAEHAARRRIIADVRESGAVETTGIPRPQHEQLHVYAAAERFGPYIT